MQLPYPTLTLSLCHSSPDKLAQLCKTVYLDPQIANMLLKVSKPFCAVLLCLPYTFALPIQLEVDVSALGAGAASLQERANGIDLFTKVHQASAQLFNYRKRSTGLTISINILRYMLDPAVYVGCLNTWCQRLEDYGSRTPLYQPIFLKIR